MIEEFDKEIDALLRQTAQQGETASLSNHSQSAIRNPHLDADEISAFAENALPDATRQRFMSHFADCDRCRKILSNTISLNSELVSEIVHAPEKSAEIVSVAPWYRRFFAAPNLVYAMGALVLIFGGLIAFTFLKNAPQTAEVSQMREIPIDMKGASSDGATRIIESNAAMSNSALMASNTPAANAAILSKSNIDSTTNNSSISNSAANSNKLNNTKSETIKTAPQSETESVQAKKEKTESLNSTANFAEQKRETSSADKARSQDENVVVQSDAPSPKTAAPSVVAGAEQRVGELPVNGRSTGALKTVRPKTKESVETETRFVGGRTFKRQNSVWYDVSYNGQSTTNISRGTDEYKKLDGGLRSIADSFGGTVVVVWKAKAYRIQ